MDNREIPKAIRAKMPAIDVEEIAEEKSLIEVHSDHIAFVYAKRDIIKQLFTDEVLKFFTISGIIIILLSFWTTWKSANYFTAKQTIMHVVDNNLTPTKEDERNGYDEIWAEYYKKYKDPEHYLYKGPKGAEEYLDIEVKNHYLMGGSIVLTILFDLAVFSLGVGCILWCLNKLSEVLTFNRDTGIVTLKRLFGLKTYSGNFHDNKTFKFRMISSTFKHGNQISLAFCFPAYNYQYDFGNPYIDEYVSFLTHYMDRNRPLPAGTAFDPYREADFERRKAEGFPKPMYPSSIRMTDYDGKKRQL